MGGRSSKPTSAKEYEDVRANHGNVTFDIAITGATGAGKSSLVNALRGMRTDEEAGAAVADVIEPTTEPMAYVHPAHPEIVIWDLPEIGTTAFKGKEYVKDMHFQKYDFFIIVAENRFTEDDIQLVCEIQKLNKKFIYVRTKVDVSISSEMKKPNFDVEKLLEKIRINSCENMTKARESSPRVFLVSRWDLDMYDFPRLQKTLQEEWDDFKRHPTRLPPELEGKRHDSDKIIMGGRSSKPTSAKEYEDVRANHGNVTFDIAITGATGAGKSSLVNALRGMRTDEEAGAAVADVIEPTTEPMAYVHPAHPEIVIWDLPEIGTTAFKGKEYVKDMHFQKYDFFIIVAENRFTEDDIQLVCEIQKLNKKFIYVRTKVDVSISSEMKKPNFDVEKLLEKIRINSCENMTKARESSPRVFLVSRWDLDMYDFPRLQKTLQEEWDDFKRHPTRLPPELEGKRHDSDKIIMGGRSSKPTSAKEYEDVRANHGNVTFDIAITGAAGAGKSSLVNALRGMRTDEEAGAAVTDVIESTTEPMAYVHPAHPEIVIWDLPGIGTTAFKGKEYVKDMNFQKYDFFIIVAENRFTEDDIRLIHEIQKLNRKFLYVRTKVDVSISSERKNPNFDVERILETIRINCSENLTKAGESSPRVFLVSRWDLDMYDFPRLQKTLQEEWDDFKRHPTRLPPELEGKRHDRSNKPSRGAFLGSAISKAILKTDLEKLKLALEKDDILDVAAEVQQELDLLKNATLDIAITGRSGAGKSSLVNGLRGMTDYEAESAETGVVQTTMEPKGYPHPVFPKVTIWDLPGIGTPEFQAKQYLRKVNFSKYDFFIIASSGRFTEHDIMLAKEIQRLQKKFYYVRTHVDVNIDSEERKQNFSEEKTLEKIRNNCLENLRKAGESSPRVFLISRWDLDLYDFPSLHDTLEEELDDLKRYALISATPIFSGEMIKKKKAALEALIWKLALVSCFVGALPVPGLSFVCDLGILVGALVHFCKVFGLDEDSLRTLANRVGKPIKELRSAIKNIPLPRTINIELVLGLLSKSLLCATLTVIELVCDFVPVLGSIVGGVSSFVCTFTLLRSFLQNVEVDAANVRAKAREQKKSPR